MSETPRARARRMRSVDDLARRMSGKPRKIDWPVVTVWAALVVSSWAVVAVIASWVLA